MGLNSNPLGYAGYAPGVTAGPQQVNSTVRAATAAEAAAGTRTDLYISPATESSSVALDFASPPASGFGSTTKRPVHATTLESTGNTTLGTTGATVNTIGNSNASSTTTITAGTFNLGMTATGGTYPGSNTGVAPAAGLLGEQIVSTVAFASAVASLTTVVTTVTSISLTPGTWDVTGVVNFTGMTTATYQQASINNSAALGTPGDNLVAGVFGSTTAGDFSLVVPSWRFNATTTTTIFLVAEGTYSAGTGKVYGRISAKRSA